MKKFLMVAAVAAFGTVGAQAADLGARPYAKAPPAVAMVSDWSGFYVGGNIGYGWGENTNPILSVINPGNLGGFGSFLTTGLPGLSSGNLFPNLNPSGVFGGIQAGYDRQYGNWVLGAVADIQASDFSANRLVVTPAVTTGANADESLSAKISWFGTVRGKAGVAMGDWMAYGTGGLAYGNTESSIRFACTVGGVGCGAFAFAGSSSSVRVGWSAGAGISRKFAGNWIVGLEYLHVDLGRTSVTAFDTTGVFSTTTITESQRFAEDMVRLTVNYKFGGAVVAKY